ASRGNNAMALDTTATRPACRSSIDGSTVSKAYTAPRKLVANTSATASPLVSSRPPIARPALAMSTSTGPNVPATCATAARPAAAGLDALGQLFQALAPASEKTHPGPVPGQLDGQRLADARRRTGDENRFAPPKRSRCLGRRRHRSSLRPGSDSHNGRQSGI